MERNKKSRLAVRAAANLVAVLSVATVFAVKAAQHDPASRPAFAAAELHPGPAAR